MKNFIEAFNRQVREQPNKTAVLTHAQKISYLQLYEMNHHLSEILNDSHHLAVALPNSVSYIAIDLYCVFSNKVLTPVPHFFSQEQMEHLLIHSSVDTVIAAVDSPLNSLLSHFGFSSECIKVNEESFVLHKRSLKHVLNNDALKVSYTSGTTSSPKGVLISRQTVDALIYALQQRVEAEADDRHLVTLPFSLLLENICGLYVILASGGTCLLPGLDELGWKGSSELDAGKFIKTIQKYQPSTMVMVPAVLQLLLEKMQAQTAHIKSLRYVAVGGAPVANPILKAARSCGLPVYQGYGLTECCSVVSVNGPSSNREGSVGKPLSHVSIRIAEDGEILVAGSVNHGYLGDSGFLPHQEWATGDLGYFDDDGYLYITGRKRTSYCTAYGRNVSPEWVECHLLAQEGIMQSLVYGEGRKKNLAILVTTLTDQQVESALNRVNSSLPDYAQIGAWLRADEAFTLHNKQLNASGFVQREVVYKTYEEQIEYHYKMQEKEYAI